MKRPNWKAIGFLAFIALGAVSAALGCPFFRNPENYMSAPRGPGRGRRSTGHVKPFCSAEVIIMM